MATLSALSFGGNSITSFLVQLPVDFTLVFKGYSSGDIRIFLLIVKVIIILNLPILAPLLTPILL
jgi:hypothetical protein